MLAWKLAERGGQLELVDPRNTSRTCPACGHVAAQNRRTQASFACVACGHQDHADINAAVNILNRHTAAGQAVAARGGTPHQRPVEAGTSRKNAA